MNELETWLELHTNWLHAKAEAEMAQLELCEKTQYFLLRKGEAPNYQMQQRVDSLWLNEVEKRGLLDEFISDHYE